MGCHVSLSAYVPPPLAALRVSPSDHTIATARVPLASIVDEHLEKEYFFEGTALCRPRSDEPLATLDVSVIADWGMSNTSGGDFGNSAFEFARRRKASGAGDGGGCMAGGGVGGVIGGEHKVHMARDKFVFEASVPPEVPPMDPPPAAPGFRFDAARYNAYTKAKAAMQPSTRTTLRYDL